MVWVKMLFAIFLFFLFSCKKDHDVPLEVEEDIPLCNSNLEKRYDFNPTSLVVLPEGGYMLAVHQALKKTNEEGEVIWEKQYRTTSPTEPQFKAFSVKRDSDGGFIIFCEGRFFEDGYNEFYLIKTDAQGNELWANRYGTPGEDFLYDLVVIPEGGYLLCGYTSEGNQPGGNVIDLDIFLVRVDEQGNELWSKIIGGAQNDEIATTGKIIPGSGFVIGGSSSNSGVKDILLVRLDLEGNEFWRKTYPNAFTQNHLYEVEYIPDEGFVLAGSVCCESGSYGIGRARLIRTGLNGDELWSGGYDSTTAAIHIEIKPDGSFYFAGEDSDSKSRIVISHVDEQGEVVSVCKFSYCCSGGWSAFNAFQLIGEGETISLTAYLSYTPNGPYEQGNLFRHSCK